MGAFENQIRENETFESLMELYGQSLVEGHERDKRISELEGLEEVVVNNRAVNQLVFSFLRKLRSKLGMEPPSAILDMNEESCVMLGMVQAEIDGRAAAEAALVELEEKT